jgi:RNA polymerase sigma-70 factor (ECF subfamily)
MLSSFVRPRRSAPPRRGGAPSSTLPAAAPGLAPALRAQLPALRPKLRRAARRLTAQLADIEDLVQETFLRALETRFAPFPDARFKGWLVRVLHNIHCDRLRRGRREVLLGDDAEQILAQDEPAPPRWRCVSDQDLTSALASLPDAYAQTYRLYAIHHLSYAAIAMKLAVPANTVGTRIRRAREQLRRELLGAGGDSDDDIAAAAEPPKRRRLRT